MSIAACANQRHDARRTTVRPQAHNADYALEPADRQDRRDDAPINPVGFMTSR
jgi:hypothetical protein